ncbi:MAG: hypothetical protein WCL28_13545, partial [bacterium]
PCPPYAGQDPSITGVLRSLSFFIGSAAAFLFLYDSAHNFYRSFYVHHFTSVALTLFISTIAVQPQTCLVRRIGLSVAAFAAVSMLANALLLLPPLWRGYEGPSLSIFRDWSSAKREVEVLAHECGADLNRGRIIVDDLTQDAVLTRSVVFPVTYLSLQASITRISIPDVLQRLSPNYAILQCRNFELIKIQPQGTRGDLCCFNFNGHGN